MDHTIVAVPSTTPAGLEAPRSQHFGRAEYFIVAHVEHGRVTRVTAIANQPEAQGGHGQIARGLIEDGLTDIVTAGIGEGMSSKFMAAGVSIWMDRDSATVGEAIAGYLSGSLSRATEADIHAGHHTH